MPASNEPEKYSIDEMMERLKNRPAEDPLEEGEMVTRADGTHAIKVRKRKRRSHQPQKEMRQRTRKVRIIQLSAVMFLLLAVVGVACSAIFYANSAPFREKIVRMIGESSGAEVRLEEFRVNPSRAVAGRLVLDWPDDSLLRGMTVRGVSAAVSPSFFMGNSIKGEEIYFSEAELRLGAPSPTLDSAASPSDPQPSSVRIERYAVSRLRASFGDPARPSFSLLDSEASYSPLLENGRPQLLLNRGKVQFLGWPALRMDRAHIEFRDREIDIINLSLLPEPEEEGKMNLIGTARPYSTSGASKLDVSVEWFPIQSIIGPDLGNLFSGRVETQVSPKSNFLSIPHDVESGPSLALALRNAPESPLETRGFPFMTQLSAMLEDNWYKNPVFENEVRFTLLREGAAVTLKDLHLEEKSRMTLSGELAITADRRLSGTLQVGIPKAMIQAAGGTALMDMFGTEDQGLRWITLEISGVGNKPADNFLTIADAPRSPRQKSTDAFPPSDKVPSFEDLTTPE